MFKQSLAALTIVTAFSTSAFAQDYKIGDLTINNPVARATVPGAKVGGGYLTITNTGTVLDRLVGGSASFAGKVEIHEMKMQNDVMKMNQVEGGLEIAPGETIKLAPGGNHVMFMKLEGQLTKGEERKATLVFEKAGTIDVTFTIISIAESMKLKTEMKHGMKHKMPKSE